MLKDSSQRAEVFREKLESDIWLRGLSAEEVVAQIMEFLRNVRLGHRNIGPDHYSRPFTVWEIYEVVRKVPSGRSSRPHGLPYEVWKTHCTIGGADYTPPTKKTRRKFARTADDHFDNIICTPLPDTRHVGPHTLSEIMPGLKWLTRFANRALLEGEVPLLAAIQEVVPGFKRGDPQGTENYWFFALSCTLGKIIRRAIAERLYRIVEPFIPEWFFGFVKGRGTGDEHHVLRRTIEQFLWGLDINLIITSLDFWKAYDRVFIEALEVMLDSWGSLAPSGPSSLPSSSRCAGLSAPKASLTVRVSVKCVASLRGRRRLLYCS